MNYLALYRKYRSKSFDELVGQEAIVTTLKNALKSNKFSHAYLFSGPRGTGKTSVARLLAKALNCEEGIGMQCNKCSNCISINEGSHPDVIEIDAASNSGVDEVRNLIDKVKYLPIKGRYKIYIIDEVHMMTNSAFNALLKTLEEPPAHVVFILCTTEPYKLLPTILSRCQRYEFSKINSFELKKLLIRVLKSENITYDSGVLDSLIEISNGGARDALSILDQLIAFSGKHIPLNAIEKVFGLTTNEDKIKLLEGISHADTLATISFLESLISRNVDINRLNMELLNILKDSLIYKKTKNIDVLETCNKKDVEMINSLFSEDRLILMIDLLLECQNEFKTTSNPNFLFEIYLLKMLGVSPKSSLFSTEKLAEPQLNVKNNTLTEDDVEIKQEEKKKEIATKSTAIHHKMENEFTPLLSEGETNFLDKDAIVKIMVLGKKEERKNLIEKRSLIDSLLNDAKFGAYAALLKDGHPFIVTNSLLILGYDFKKPAQKVNIKENERVLTEIIKKIFNINLRIYALNREEQTTCYSHYLNLQQINKLPKPNELDEITLN